MKMPIFCMLGVGMYRLLPPPQKSSLKVTFPKEENEFSDKYQNFY